MSHEYESPKESSSVSDPESSGSGPDESSSSSGLSEPYGSSSGSSGSSSCECGFEIWNIQLGAGETNEGTFEIHNTGSCEITGISVTGALSPVFLLVVPDPVPPGGVATVAVSYGSNPAGTVFTVHTSCGSSAELNWPA